MILHCEAWGQTQDHTLKLLFLHGLGGTGKLWRPLAANLEDQYTLLAPDQRGHGQSQIPNAPQTSYTPLDYGHDLSETLSAKQFFPTWVIGHSMGVRSAAALAHLHPDQVLGLVLIDLGLSGPAGGGLGALLLDFLKILPKEFNSRTQCREYLLQHSPDPSIAQYLAAVSITDPKTGKTHFPFDVLALIQTIKQSVTPSIKNWLIEYTTKTSRPIYLLRGQTSTVWSKEDFENEKISFKNFPQVQFIEFQNTGHGLPFEKRNEFINFLKQTIKN